MSRLRHSFEKAITSTVPLLVGTRHSQRLTILIYHRVLAEPDPVYHKELVAPEFDWHMALLARHFNPLPLSSALEMLREGQLPERAVCVTFDDGYSDNEQVALPILRRWSIPASIFIATGHLNGGMMWNDVVRESIRIMGDKVLDLTSAGLDAYKIEDSQTRRIAVNAIISRIKHWAPNLRSDIVSEISAGVSGLPDDLMMTDEQVKNLDRNGVEIGAHTCSHPILASLDDAKAADEIESSRAYLASLLGKPVRYFAYPNGKPGEDYFPVHQSMVQNMGFEAALSTQWGAVTRDSDLWQLPRFTPWDRTPLRFLLRLLLNYKNPA